MKMGADKKWRFWSSKFQKLKLLEKNQQEQILLQKFLCDENPTNSLNSSNRHVWVF